MTLLILLRSAADTQDELLANVLAAGAPTAGTPAIHQAHDLGAAGTSASAPSVATPAFGQTHVLGSVGAAAGVPNLGSADIAQIHVLAGSVVDAGAPTAGEPALFSGTVYALEADGVSAGAPSLGSTNIYVGFSAAQLLAAGFRGRMRGRRGRRGADGDSAAPAAEPAPVAQQQIAEPQHEPLEAESHEEAEDGSLEEFSRLMALEVIKRANRKGDAEMLLLLM